MSIPKVSNDGTMNSASKACVADGLEQLTDAVALNNFAHGWRAPGDEPRPIGDLIALLHSEVTEAFEAYRNNEPPLWFEYDIGGEKTSWNEVDIAFQPSYAVPGHPATLGKPQGIASELADVLIRVLDMAEEYKIDLAQAVFLKHEYNQTRPYKHGGKAV